MTAEGNMVDEDVDAVDALARLEAALDRIAEGARPGPGPQAVEPAAPEIAERLDALIAQLRDALHTEASASESQATDALATDNLANDDLATAALASEG